ncbi:MAG: NADH-quinone oxidoreductase subunit F [Dehalococcoidales bacterium]|jgi:NADH-quinone oxidoreductase subunit F|nr:NADH-quinone oxidoreductase subunit F [Dehalococcoidales bacterium]MDP6221832.1 NADH-quinone oxidoreductase subunit NuoF [Dehalococcoidales bacterium]MDP7110023.1 NADH-quinone oxidoreductase subunit NuoF [Dehalococcoidales bacterium]MDP7309561.1 NADH-quinone oxidoreductase subunit NuoF [Dehalococcoidales bacterium]MDP7409506.1 NADH-quinone oxidoreductase subunit NuoF [Dehalococcoidales bacterium]|tara:strand:- start:1943 stop:3871 length:1929 start_codon:yes stop_codon:yes gene_type:complete
MMFDKIRKQAIAEWATLQQSQQPRILLGTATCGRAAGAMSTLETMNRELARHNINAIVTQVGCIGLCYIEPLVDIVKPNRPRICYSSVTPKIIPQLIEDYLVKDNPRPDLALGTIGDGTIEGIPRLFDLPMLKPQVRIVLRNCGHINPEDIKQYIANDGYTGFIKAINMGPERVLGEIKKSELRGRGGAGFPTGQKWEFCRRSPGKEKYIICNADEGDPGAFMNRALLEGDPHSVLEGMLIGAYTIGATHGYIYCRAEYPLAIERLSIALNRMREYGLLGDNILDSNFSFDMEIKEGAGAFICGEETALMASIEGKRGMPRPRPPFPAVSGLWGKPTNINNAETWANVALILQKGSEWYDGFGSQTSKGTKTFALVGKIERTGLIEVPLGIRLRDIIYEIGGGIADGKQYKAVQTGGPSGGCLPASLLDSPVDYDSLVKAGSMMGSGGMVVADEDTCMVDFARFFLSFSQAESCGKCVPCRIGTHQMFAILERITRGEGKLRDIEQLEQLSQLVKTTSLCGLGQTAPNPVLTTLRYFRDEYEAHINKKKCPSLVCTKLINYYILPDKCAGCMLCLRDCPAKAIVGGRRLVHIISQEKCTKCGACLDVCPERFGAVVKVSGEKVIVPGKPIPVAASKSLKNKG